MNNTSLVLAKGLKGLRSNMDLKELSVLALLDPTAAFDTGDHSVHTFWFASMVLTGFSLILLNENFIEQWMLSNGLRGPSRFCFRPDPF